MAILHAKYFKIVPANGNLGSATELKLALDSVSIKKEGKLVEHFTSDHPAAAERYEIGSLYEIKGTLVFDDPSILTYIFGGAYTAGVYTKQQGIRTLPNYDIRIGHVRTDGETVPEDFTDVNFTPLVEQSFEQGKRTYLPFTAMGTATSENTLDNSAA